MSENLENIFNLIFLVFLLILSGFFSGSETAFFNLSRKQSVLLKTSPNRVCRLAYFLLSSPKKLLTALLFGNMIVNVLYFALSSMVALDIDRKMGHVYALATGAFTFIALVIFGEMLPKSIAYANSKRFSVLAALPCYLLVKVLHPLLCFFDILIIEPAVRLILSLSKRKDFDIKVSHIKMLVDLSSQKGSITADQNQLISEVLELSFLKVKNVMRPRVDLVCCDINADSDYAVNLMSEKFIKKLPVYENAVDNIVGVVSLRDLMLNPTLPLKQIMKTPHFIPEMKSLESTIEYFKSKQIDLAVVVDEYGGIAGLLTMKDIIFELLGTKAESAVELNITQIGPLEYRLPGNLPMHDWADAFGLEIDKTKYATLGGFVTALFGKIPQENDEIHLKNLRFTVEKVENYRIKFLRLKLLHRTRK